MALNNLCRSLIVYGSYIPGGKNHNQLSDLPGEWLKGKILGCCQVSPDDLALGKTEIEAWVLHFSDCQAQMFTPEWDLQKRRLHQRWTTLDQRMGESWARYSMRWWPEGADPIVGQNGMRVLNIYVPLKNFPFLANQDDVPAPEDADNLELLWQRQKSGERHYDSCHFISLIKDSQERQWPELFGDLPNASSFLKKLHQLFQDHRLQNGSLLKFGESEFFGYVVPLERNRRSPEDLIELSRRKVSLYCELLALDDSEDAIAARKSFQTLKYEFVACLEDEETVNWDDPGVYALERIEDVYHSLLDFSIPWISSLSEACYGLTADKDIQAWLMNSWHRSSFDFSSVYELWKAGASFKIRSSQCLVYEVEGREA